MKQLVVGLVFGIALGSCASVIADSGIGPFGIESSWNVHVTQADLDACRARGGLPRLFGGGHTNTTMICFSPEAVK